MITYREAIPQDFESMSTMVGRAFPPDALPMTFPNTPAMRKWWVDIYDLARRDPAAKLLVAVDKEVIGLFTMTSSKPMISMVPLTPDHDPSLNQALVEFVDERPTECYAVELVAVDKEYQGHGIGRRLTQWACEIADAQDLGIWLQTSAAREYYLKSGLAFEATKSEGAGGVIWRPKRSIRERA